jgi:hypothetical protein
MIATMLHGPRAEPDGALPGRAPADHAVRGGTARRRRVGGRLVEALVGLAFALVATSMLVQPL